MRHFRLFCFLFCLGFSSSRAFAEELTLERCLELSRQKSVDAIQAILSVEGAKAASRQARSARMPQLFFSGQLLRSDDASSNLPDDNNATVAVEQRLLPFNSDWMRGREQDVLYQAAVSAKLETQQDVDLAVKRLYFSILQGEDAERNMAQVDAQLHRLLETVVPKYSVGRTPAFDPVKVRAALADLARDRRAIESQLAEERETLSLIIGVKDGVKLELSPIKAFPELPGNGFLEVVLSSNPTLQTQAKRIEAAQLGMRAARYMRFPDVVGHLDYNEAAQAASLMTPGWTASVGLRLPIFDWGGISSQIEQQRVALDAARAQLEADRQSVLSSMTGALNRAKAHQQDRTTYQELVPQVHEIALAGVTRYRRGATGILEATDGVNLWLNTLLAERSAYYSYLSDLAQLERLSGEAYKATYEP